MDIAALGRGIRERRLALDCGLEQLGRQAAARGIRVPTGSYISRMERGKAPRPGLMEVEALVQALDVPDWKTLERIGLGELDPLTLTPKQPTEQEIVRAFAAAAEAQVGPASIPNTAGRSQGKQPSGGRKPRGGRNAQG